MSALPEPSHHGGRQALRLPPQSKANRLLRRLGLWLSLLLGVWIAPCVSPVLAGANISAQFDGGDDRVATTVPVPLDNRSFSIAFWAQRNVLDDRRQYVLSQGSAGGSVGLHIGFDANNNFTFRFWGDDLNITDSSFADHNWHHWTCTYDNSTRARRVYRDGVLAGSDTASAPYRGTGIVTLGCISVAGYGPANFLLGRLDEVKIYHRALTAAEVVATLRNEPVSTANLINHWPFDSDNPTQFLSTISGGHPLTKYNGVGTSNLGDLQSLNHVANFDGTNDRLESSVARTNLANRSFTVMAWARRMGPNGVRPDGPAHWMLTHGDAGQTDRLLHFGLRGDGTFTFAFFNDDLDTPEPQTDLNWHHWAGTYDATTRARKLFRDGLLVTSDTAKGNFIGTGKIAVGYTALQSGDKWIGQIDEVKLFEAALTPDQVKQEMAPGLNSGAPELEYWDFETETSTNFASYLGPDRTSLVKVGGIASMPDDPQNKFNGYVASFYWQPDGFQGVELANRSFTLMTWARKTQDNGDFRAIFILGDDAKNQGLHFGLRNNNVFTFAFFGNDLNTPTAYHDNEWHHWVGTFDAQTKARKIYRDGVVVASDISPSNFLGRGKFQIAHQHGWWDGDPSIYWRWIGELDEVRVFGRALTQDEVRSEGVRIGSSGLLGDMLQGWTLDSFGIRGNLPYATAYFYSMIQGGQTLTAGQGRRLFDGIDVYTDRVPIAPPVIARLPDLVINEDAPTQTVTLAGIYDETPNKLDALKISATSSDPALVSQFSVNYDGTGTGATIQLAPAPDANGSASITVSASKTYGGLTVSGSRQFSLQVPGVNDPPVAGSATSLRLRGGTQSVSLPVVQGLPPGDHAHTLSAWIRVVGPVRGDQRLLTFGNPMPGVLEWYLAGTADPNAPTAVFRLYPDGGIRVPNVSINQWFHFATTWDGTLLRLYVNGVLFGQVDPAAVKAPINIQGVGFWLGYPFDPNSGIGPLTFDGNMDEVQVWNRALAESEIKANLNQPLVGNESGLVLYWRFDEGEDNRATDSAALTGSKAVLSQGTLLNGAGYERAVAPSFGTFTADAGKPTPIFLPGFDIDSPLTYSIVARPRNGTLSRTAGDWSNPRHNPILYTPNAAFGGTDSFDYQLSDGFTNTTVETISIRVVDLNDPPSISRLKTQLIDESAAPRPIPFVIGDPETPVGQLKLAASSSDEKLIPNSNLVFGGSGANRTITITPAEGEVGRCTITLSVSDSDGANTFTSFDVQVLRHVYAVIDLGTLPNRTISAGTAINDNGWVVGYSENNPNDSRAFVWQGLDGGGRLIDLGTFGGITSQAFGINNRNQVVGASRTGGGFNHAFLWTSRDSPLTDLGVLTGGTVTSASGISSHGHIVGAGSSLVSAMRAFIRMSTETTLTDLGTLGGIDAQATAINDLGTVVGFSRLANRQERAFLYEDGVIKDLGTLAPDHTGSRAWAISPTGQIVGESFLNDAGVAISFEDGKVISLGVLSSNGTSVALGVNSNGQVVGKATVTQGGTHAFLHSAGQMLDLNDLIPLESGWVLTEAKGINKNGEIVGTGTFNGRTRGFVAMPATPIGRPVARPVGTVTTRPPTVELIEGNQDDTQINSFLWVGLEGRHYAIRPVKAKLHWATSSNTADTNTVSSITVNVWPRTPQLYVAPSPVEVEPRGVPFPYTFQSVIYSTTAGVSVDLSSKIFRSSRAGWSVLYYLKTNGQQLDPLAQPPYLEVVKRTTWDDSAYLRDNVPWTIGSVLTDPGHRDYLGKQGYVLFDRAPYDGAGDDRAHDRETRLGPIIPVNLDTQAAEDDLVVAWYRTNKIGVAWSTDPVRYALSWPTNAPHIVIASGLGSGPLPPGQYPNKRIYGQPIPGLPGYNPNEEHALILPGASGDDALFSLRNDLNRIAGVSEPFSLLKFKDPASGEWRIKVFQVVAEESPYFFRYSGEAGKEIAPPYPLSVLPLCAASYGVSGPYWEDVRGKLYGKSAGPFGSTTNIVARFFYPLQPGFFYDLNKDGVQDAPLNDCVAWLDRLPGGQQGQPVDVRYEIRWPDNPPVLQVGETLFNPKRGLPGVRSMAKAAVVYDDVRETVDSSKQGAQLYDPLSVRKVSAAEGIPSSIKRQNISGMEVFTDLAFPIRVRLKYDPINKELHFSGYLDESGIGSNPLLLPNILTSLERAALLKLAPGNPNWKQIVDRLYQRTRNPNSLDLNGDGQVDDRVLVGQLVQGGRRVQESFGDLPKALTAGFSDVPPASPRPGSAIRFGGSGQLTTPSVGPLGPFTIGVWAKLEPGANGFLFRDAAGGAQVSLKAEVGNSKLVATEGSAVPHDFGFKFDTQWHFYALVRDPTAGKVFVYVDGRPLGEPFASQGTAFTGGVVAGAGVDGEMEEFQIWNIPRGGNAIRARMDRALNGAEDGLVAYYTFDGTDLGLDGGRRALNATITGGQRVAVSTAPVGIPPRFVVLSENDDLKLGALPISLKVIRIDDGPYAGDLKVIYPDNVFDERLTFRHSNDFAGDPDQVEFEWYYKPDAANFDSSELPTIKVDGSIDDVRGWLRFAKSGAGVHQITIGEGGESGLLTLGDNWFICRFRGYAVGTRPKTEWSDWVGDPASIGVPAAILGEGWVKRVIRGLNPFDARVKDFHSSPVSTFSSMLVQAGQRYEGDIAFNPSAENLNRIGLIEAYHTVLNRGRSLSIDGVPAVDFGPANNALLLAASRISDLYVLLGNEAYADAQDPTISFSTKGGSYGSLASSIFTFQNQMDSLLEEELVLLRGRDSSAAGVQGAPVYNRLFWNFTLGEGEVAYQQGYNISDQNTDGFIDEKDARVLFPQGHGDAWGHYLTALSSYYDLLRHSNYTWVPRAESVLVAGTSVQVDFLDERKFAKAAGLKAKAGVEIIDLTYRFNYVDDPGGQWQGYKDTKSERAWGVTEWAWRAGQGAYLDWVVANAILPATDTNHPPGIQKIDRTTVIELLEIPIQYDQIQARMDEADRGMNPLGLAKGVAPFDIDPVLIDDGLTHFEQIQERGLKAMGNAVRVWDEANAANNLLRENQDSVEDFAQNNEDQERDFKNRLIEIFGYPYGGDIGPGQTYPSGYDGPDLVHYMYVETAEITGKASRPSAAFRAFFTPLKGNFAEAGITFPGDTPFDQPIGFGNTASVDYPVSTADYAFVAPDHWGKRRAPGQLQEILSDLLQAEVRMKQAIANYDKLNKDMKDIVKGLEGEKDFGAERIKILDKRNNSLKTLAEQVVGVQSTALFLRTGADLAYNLGDAVAEFLPEVTGTATDVTSAARGASKTIGTVASAVLSGMADGLETAGLSLERDKELTANAAELELETIGVQAEVVAELKQVLSMLREEPNLRLEIFNQREAMAQILGRYQGALAAGQRVVEERLAFRQRAAAQTTESRYQDMTFRIFRDDALQKYRAQFDQAARYVFLAATAYDYETTLIGDDARSGRTFLTDIIRQRSLGQLIDGNPIAGRPGLADAMARMSQNFDVLKTQLGFNQPQIETGRFSLRSELFRLRNSSDAAWRDELKKSLVANLWDVPEFRRYCRPFAPESLGAQPGIVIRFPTTVTFGQNFFGWPLGGGDSAYDPSRFATKVRSVGVWFSGYDGNGLSLTPRVYLVPIGMDVLRSPTPGDFRTREWRVIDQVLPVPFPIGATTLKDPGWRPDQSLGGSFADIRRFASFRGFHDGGTFDESEAISDSRLIGRSVWNTEWMLVIPGGTFLADANMGLDTFIGNINDIKIFFQTYSYAGN